MIGCDRAIDDAAAKDTTSMDLAPRLLKLISEYQLHVAGLTRTLRKRFGVDDLIDAWRQGRIPTHGEFDDRRDARFEFHGVGCRVESPCGNVEFDLGPGGRYDGFDGWRLWIYAQALPQEYPEFQRYEVVESVLGELVTDGLVVRMGWMPSPHLCYLREDCGDAKPSPERPIDFL